MGLIQAVGHDRLYVDSAIIIYFIEHHPAYYAPLNELWKSMTVRGEPVFTSELSVFETLVVPLRLNDLARVTRFRNFFAEPMLQLLPIERSILDRGAQLRADHGSLKIPDAIHGSTFTGNASRFLTNDQRLSRLIPESILLDAHIA